MIAIWSMLDGQTQRDVISWACNADQPGWQSREARARLTVQEALAQEARMKLTVDQALDVLK